MSLIVADRVKETTTTIGAGDLTLDGAILGYSAFSSRCAVGDTLYYSLQGVDSFGTPTGEWECGLGTYSAANTLTRGTVYASSASNAVVDLSAGTKQIYITLLAVQVKWVRERVSSPTFYVRTDGSNANDGRANSAARAFLTIQKAIDTLYTLDLNGNGATIQLGNWGTYAGFTVNRPFIGAPGNIGTVKLKGDSTFYDSYIISGTGDAIKLTDNACLSLEGFTVTSAGGNAIAVSAGAKCYYAGVYFGACTKAHVYASSGGLAKTYGNNTVVGIAANHLNCDTLGLIDISATRVTLNADLTTAFCSATTGASVLATTSTFTVNATPSGSKYLISMNATVNTNGLTLPGTTTTAPTTGGQYA